MHVEPEDNTMAMDGTRYPTNAAAVRGLARHGLVLGGLAQTRSLAPGSRIEGPCAIQARVETGAHLRVGAFCDLNGGTINNVEIGRYCSFGPGVVIGSHEHPTDWLTTSRIAYYPALRGWDRLAGPAAAPALHGRRARFPDSCPVTTLGPDVLIGQGAFIKAGVTIGAGAIVGARATVVRDVPPYAVVVGTPGRVLRLRFPEATVERLLRVQWWRYSIYDLFDAPMDHTERALDVIEDKVAAGGLAPYVGPVLAGDELTDLPAALARLEETPLAPAN